MTIPEYIGTPYKSHGRSLEEGVDCYGLVKLYYHRELDIELGEHWYEKNWWKEDCKETVNLMDKPDEENFVRVDEPQEHDVVFFRMVSDVVNHMGVYVNDGKILHSQDGQQVLCEPLDRKLHKCVHSIWRHESLV